MPLIVLLALGWATGLWLANQLNQPWWAWLVFAGLAAACLATTNAYKRLRLPLACALVVGLGAARFEAARAPFGAADFLPTYNDRGVVTLEGVVAETPATPAGDTRTDLRLRVDTLYLPGAANPLPVHGLVLVYAPRHSAGRLTATGQADFQYGDRLAVTGALMAPPGLDRFSYRAYLARSGVHSQLPAQHVTFLAERQAAPASQALFDFRARALSTVRRLFAPPHSELLAGILLGVDSGLPADVADAFAATSTSHLIAISGFNITLLAGAITALTFRLWGRWRGALAAIGVIAAYTLLVGASGSVVRAAIMGSLALIAHQVARRAHALNTLAATALLMTAFNPHWLWDVGFQLSSLATLGLVLYATPWERRVQQALGRVTTRSTARRLAALVGETFLVTVAAQITTLPLILLYSQRLSLSSLPANFLVLPAQPALMITSGLALLLGLVWPPLGQLAAWLAWPFSAYTLAIVEFFGSVPGGSFYLGEITPAVVVVVYALLFGLTWLLARPAQQRPAWWRDTLAPRLPAGGFLLLFSSAILVWGYYFSLPQHEDRLRVTMLDVGTGEALLIQTPGGAHALIGGGAGGRTLTRALAEHMPLATTTLNLLVIAAPEDEHLGALPEVLERYQVERAVLTSATDRSAAYRVTLDKLYAEPGLDLIEAAALPAFDLGDGVTLRVLADGPRGSTLRLEWQRFAMVLPIGLDAEGETDLLVRGLAQPATVLLLGRQDAIGDNWLHALNPRVVLISTAAGSGYPPADLLARLAGRSVLRTDVNGSVTLETDGERLWVEVER